MEEKNNFKINKIIKFLILTGAAALIYWKGDFKKTFLPKPAELFLFSSLMFSFIYALRTGLANKLKCINKPIYYSILMILFSLLIGTVYGMLKYNVGFNIQGIAYSIKLPLFIFLFITVYVFIREDELFYKNLCMAFYLSPLIFTPFLFYPGLADKFSLLSTSRFMGFTPSPNIAAMFNCIAFSFIFTIFVFDLFDKGIKKSLLFLSLSLGLGALVLWSQSRAYFIALLFSIIFPSFLVSGFYFKERYKVLLISFLMLVLIIPMFFILPNSVKRPLILRLSYFEKLAHPATFATTSVYEERLVPNSNKATTKLVKVGTAPDARVTVLKYYFQLLKKDPLIFVFGLGINHESRFNLILNKGEVHCANSILDIILFGGVGLAAALVALFILIIINLRKMIAEGRAMLQVNIFRLGSITALLGMWCAAIFIGSPLFGFHFWILLAMSLV
jgi:hypothetical protein